MSMGMSMKRFWAWLRSDTPATRPGQLAAILAAVYGAYLIEAVIIVCLAR